jgi:CubicO group peptidase (beta-lactamase class C family)
MGVTMELLDPAQRRRVLEVTDIPVAWQVGRDAGYSEYAAWTIVGLLVEDVTGVSLREYLRTHLLDPLGLDHTFVGMTHEEFVRVAPSIGVNWDLRRQQEFPMLFERNERVCAETNPAHGGYTNGRDLTTFYSALLARLAGGGNDALPSPATLSMFCSTVRETTFDVVLDRECAYGLGFMTKLDEHAFGDSCSETSFGHSGNVGSSFAFADPERDLAVAVVFNGLVGYDAAFLRRRALVRALYLDLDERDADADALADAALAAQAPPAASTSRLGRLLRRSRTS